MTSRVVMREDMNSAIEVLKEELNLDFILLYEEGGQIIYANDEYDITERMVTMLNENRENPTEEQANGSCCRGRQILQRQNKRKLPNTKKSGRVCARTFFMPLLQGTAYKVIAEPNGTTYPIGHFTKTYILLIDRQ